jgi:uncharacterized protein YozE (UPF0346 family)
MSQERHPDNKEYLAWIADVIDQPTLRQAQKDYEILVFESQCKAERYFAELEFNRHNFPKKYYNNFL